MSFYDAIINDKIDNIEKNDAQKYLTLTFMFLHPQSRYLFKSLYESERIKCLPYSFSKKKLVLLLKRI
jgi:hypothetical protein